MTETFYTYPVRPSLAAGAINAALALLPVVSLTIISRHLERRGAWLLLPWTVLVTVVLSGEALRHFFTVGFSRTVVGAFFSAVLLREVQMGAAAAVFVTSIVLAITRRRNV